MAAEQAFPMEEIISETNHTPASPEEFQRMVEAAMERAKEMDYFGDRLTSHKIYGPPMASFDDAHISYVDRHIMGYLVEMADEMEKDIGRSEMCIVAGLPLVKTLKGEALIFALNTEVWCLNRKKGPITWTDFNTSFGVGYLPTVGCQFEDDKALMLEIGEYDLYDKKGQLNPIFRAFLADNHGALDTYIEKDVISSFQANPTAGVRIRSHDVSMIGEVLPSKSIAGGDVAMKEIQEGKNFPTTPHKIPLKGTKWETLVTKDSSHAKQEGGIEEFNEDLTSLLDGLDTITPLGRNSFRIGTDDILTEHKRRVALADLLIPRLSFMDASSKIPSVVSADYFDSDPFRPYRNEKEKKENWISAAPYDPSREYRIIGHFCNSRYPNGFQTGSLDDEFNVMRPSRDVFFRELGTQKRAGNIHVTWSKGANPLANARDFAQTEEGEKLVRQIVLSYGTGTRSLKAYMQCVNPVLDWSARSNGLVHFLELGIAYELLYWQQVLLPRLYKDAQKTQTIARIKIHDPIVNPYSTGKDPGSVDVPLDL
jgi:hypothetical protein